MRLCSAFLLLLVLCLGCSSAAQQAVQWRQVVRVVDGDTLLLDRKDRFGRTLAYVYLEDGTFLNAEIVRQGYGHAYTRFPFKYLDEFRGYEREAREAQRGLWKPLSEKERR